MYASLYDTRGVTRWVSFEYYLRVLTEQVGTAGYHIFLATPTGVFVFGDNGGVAKILNPPQFLTTYRKPLLPENVNITRWNSTVNGFEVQMENLGDNIVLGNITKTPTMCFRDMSKNMVTEWGAERVLAETLPPQLLNRLLKSTMITTPPDPPICLSSAISVRKQGRGNKKP